MKDKTVELLATKVDTAISTLSTKLGVAADHFYPILVKQSVVNGWFSLTWSVVFGVISIGLWLWAKKATKGEGAWATMLAIFCTVGFISFTYAGVLNVVNPEYYALKEITALLK